MSTPYPNVDAPRVDAVPDDARSVTGLRAWLREPLLHFVVLGALLFAIDHALVARRADPRTIVVSATVDEDAKTLFRGSRGRDPNPQELAALRQRWIDNEVLYREGLALGVDQGDSTIRERVIFKSLSVVDASLKLPPYDDALLRRWFESRRANYDEPARYDFQEAVLAGEHSESAVRAFVDALNAGTPGDARAGLRVFKARPAATLVETYGAEFAAALESAPPGQWRALPARGGLRAIRLDAATPARPAAFEAIRDAVRQDWIDATLAEQRTLAVRTLARKYRIAVEAGAR